MSAYAELLKELQGEHDALAKALPAEGDGDDKIAAAAAEGGDGKGEPDGDEGKAGVSDGDADDKGKEPMAKSMTVKLEDGSEAEAIDATDLIKSLSDEVKGLGGKLTETEGTLAKALSDTLELVKGQTQLIKSLTERVTALGSKGAGRKAVLTVHEPLAKSQTAQAEPEGVKPQELLVKALGAQKEGRLMAHQVSAIETYVNTGRPVPEHLVKAALGV